MTGFGKQFAVVLVVAAVAGAAGFTVSRLTQAPNAQQVATQAAKDSGAEGQALPEAQLHDLDGKPHALAEYKGRWLLVNFWASWCAPCMEEIPALIAAQNTHGPKGLQVLGIAMDDPEEARKTVRNKGINYPTLVGDDDVLALMEKLGNTMGALPYSVLISPEGVVRDLELGGLTTARLDRWGKLVAGG